MSYLNKEISNIGKELLQYQEDIAKQFGYKRQPNDIADANYQKYINTLPKGFISSNQNALIGSYHQGAGQPVGYEIIPNDKFPIYSRSGTLIAQTYDRIVIGQYGAFIEIDDKDIIKDNVKTAPSQEYRKTEKYKYTVKYFWDTTKDNSNCKLYHQQGQVVYADYQINKWYISPYEVLDRDELKELDEELERL